jgi:predicted Rossmann fold nucleotide-binding protein DprA/Smf involved in DNA uptake
VKDAAGQTSAPQAFTIQVFPHGFKATGNMGSARQSHTATLLNDGTVLVTGGSNSDTRSLATAELYDPIGKTFAATTGDMTSSRYWHTATLLNDGTVLVIGGRDINDETLATAELYDPSTKTFTATTDAMASRPAHAATC